MIFVDDSRVDGDWQSLYRREMRERDFDAAGNRIDIRSNRDFDPSRMDDDDGYLFFPYIMEFTPSDAERTEDEQVVLARSLKKLLEGIGCRVVIAANFEDRV